jgi:ABC-type transport system involved in cytochrome bd biosynthesis fused ATPase/permease subunit
MALRAALADLRALSTRGVVRRAAFVGALAFVERLLTPAAAWILLQRTLREKLAVGFVFGAVFTLRSFAQRVFMSWTEADLIELTAASVLEGDVLRPNVLPDQDAHLELVQAVFHASTTMSQTLPSLLADLLACVALSGVVIYAEPARLVAFAATLTLVAGAALLVSRRSVERAVERAWKIQARVYEAFVDALEGRLEIVASGLRGAFIVDLRERTRAWGAAGVRVAMATALSGRLPMLAIAGLVASAVVIGAGAHGALSASLADVALFASVTPAFAGVAQGLHGLARAERWTGVVARVLRSTSAPWGGTSVPPALPATIAFEKVSFRYEGSPAADPALHDVDFAWSGGLLALAGANGSGKSTCLRLLLALAAPEAGAIMVGGTRLDDINADAWCACVAFLPQRPYLPPRSDVRRAVQWLAPDATDDRILHALERVGLLASLQRKGGEPLEARVDSLSVGERQRVALARLLCRPASLFLLDEPDANLDREGIAVVADVLCELSRRGMVAFAAHTPELLAVAEQVVVLSGGRVLRKQKATAYAVRP